VILHCELAANLPPVRGDRDQLQQVILNLLRNAADAMADIEDRPRQRLIRTALDEEDRVRLAVQDVGVGFEPHNAEKLFAPFYTTKTGRMGMWVWLSGSTIEL